VSSFARVRPLHLVVILSGFTLLLATSCSRATPPPKRAAAPQQTSLAALPATQRSTATPPTPQPLGQQQTSMTVGAAAERNGDYTVAETAYRALAASSDTATAAVGQLALGRFLERRGLAADASTPLQTAATALAGTLEGLRATFLLGEAQADQQQNQAAAASFQAYLTGGGAAAGYAALERAWALQADGDHGGALSALTGPLQATSAIVRRAALQAASHSLEQLGEPGQAAADQLALADTLSPDAGRAGALLEAGRLYQIAGDGAGATLVLREVVQRYPSSAAASTALDRLDALALSVDPLQRAIVLFNAGRSDSAQTALTALLRTNPSAETAAQATYYLARIADRADDNETAATIYAEAYALDPTGSLASDALWRRAQLLKFLQRYGEAQTAYTSLLEQFPQSDNVAEAAFDRGLMAYLDGRPANATEIWTTIAHTAPSDDAARASLWLGKVALESTDAAAATAALAQALALQPTGYSGLRAELLASGASVALSGDPITRPADDWNAVESWLTARVGPEDPDPFLAVQATQDWTEGMELDALGWRTTPDALLSSALTGLAQQPWALYRAARALAARGRTKLALVAAADLLNRADSRPDNQLNAPAALLRLAYPVDYLDLVDRNAVQQRLDPLFIYAVIRQESAFDPAAGSSAGAQGLLQLEPSTAQGVAAGLGLRGITTADLQRPLINLQLGASFLANQANQAPGREMSQTLAAYNAGGSNAARWARQAGADPDRFYETIDFSETRRYIRVISANYAMYNALYRGASHPTLLHP